jgi:hypothetical protein
MLSPMERSEDVSGALRQISIRPKASTVFLAILMTGITTLPKGILFRRLYGMTSTTPCILVRAAITEVKIRERQGIDIPSPLVI